MDEMIDEHLLQKDVQDLLAERLRPREQDILRMRFGLDGNEPRTLEQVARKLGVRGSAFARSKHVPYAACDICKPGTD